MSLNHIFFNAGNIYLRILGKFYPIVHICEIKKKNVRKLEKFRIESENGLIFEKKMFRGHLGHG